MEFFANMKSSAKWFRWRWRRFQAKKRWGRVDIEKVPIVFGNAMPKSGSHLLTQVLNGLPDIGPFVNPGLPPVNRTESNTPRTKEAIVRSLRALKAGDIRYGYLHAVNPYLKLLTQDGWATIFIYRDPRDMLVSHVFYATEMNEQHGMYQYYNEYLHTMEERINAAIEGVNVPGYELASVRQRYDSYLGWLDEDGVLPVKFEDLILARKETIFRIIDFLNERGFRSIISKSEEAQILESAIQPRKSGTFRRGEPGNWREYFTEKNKQRFKEIAGDLLIRLGYEQNNQW